jgi:hypothetical protein
MTSNPHGPLVAVGCRDKESPRRKEQAQETAMIDSWGATVPVDRDIFRPLMRGWRMDQSEPWTVAPNSFSHPQPPSAPALPTRERQMVQGGATEG